jgi:hypothetical protein
MGDLGLGVCSFSVASPPSDVKRRIDIYRKAVRACRKPLGRFVNDQAAAFTMVNCAPTKEESYAVSRDSFVWYVKRSVELITTVASWLEEMKRELGTYQYLEAAKQAVSAGAHQALNFEWLRDNQCVLTGDPDEVLATAREYEKAGVDLLLCLVNPYAIPHEKVMQTIELMGKHVIPKF